jgi:glycine/D-amino acid oxidase-like deaminating enzyme
VAHKGIDWNFECLDGYLFVLPGVSTDVVEHELVAAQRAGLSEVRLLSRATLPFFDTGPCLYFPRQAQFHPLKYLVGLTGSIQAGGGHIFTETHATEMTGGSLVT